MKLSLMGRAGLFAAASVLSIAALASVANAQGPYTPITSLDVQVQTNDIDTPPAGFTFVQTLTTPFSYSAGSESLAGSLTSSVFRSNTTSTLDFLYQLTITSGSAGAGVSAVNFNDFRGINVAVGADNDANINGSAVTGQPLIRPFGAQKTSAGFVAFAFNGNARTNNEPGPGDGGVTVGRTSAVLAIRTDSTLFSVQNGSVSANASGNADILGPTAVPEAGTLAFLLPGIALGAVAVIRRKK